MSRVNGVWEKRWKSCYSAVIFKLMLDLGNFNNRVNEQIQPPRLKILKTHRPVDTQQVKGTESNWLNSFNSFGFWLIVSGTCCSLGVVSEEAAVLLHRGQAAAPPATAGQGRLLMPDQDSSVLGKEFTSRVPLYQCSTECPGSGPSVPAAMQLLCLEKPLDSWLWRKNSLEPLKASAPWAGFRGKSLMPPTIPAQGY